MRNIKEAKIFFNRQCSPGSSLRLWNRVKNVVRNMLYGLNITDIEAPQQLVESINKPADGHRVLYIAAGDDGTVNLLINSIMKAKVQGSSVIGAVGLGFRNDFHKNLKKVRHVKGVPVRLDYRNTIDQDLIRAECLAADGGQENFFCAGSANAGITAGGSHYYNTGRGLFGFLRGVSPKTAILAASLCSLVKAQKTPARLVVGGRETGLMDIFNVSFNNNQYFAGGLKYDTAVGPDDGLMAVNVCTGIDAVAKMAAVFGSLSAGMFKCPENTASFRDKSAVMESEGGFAFEYDGEIAMIKRASLSVERQVIRCCS
ncbi:MAG: hypothetical protein LLG37_04515 [Spirochaetia bacterium]|nr:hypothetical protein [Spirochaetia bacterium]